ncbi:CBS domain-containing protein [Thiomicrospira pelophila]|uniref:CBS domain-containing protein n=1 Tax=Thiomicrospira pelophila TaxID=934 RepID=UPI0004A700C6|nr:CBS domain-containing protein [Thiomicrospira pelophila]
MFAIYNIQGRRFRDNLENLKRVHSPHQTQDVGFHANIAQDETLVVQGLTTSDTSEVNAKGVDAYKKMIHANKRERVFHAYQVMKHPVITIPLETPVQEAYHLLHSHKVNQMPVSNKQMRLVGLVTLNDLYSFYNRRW